MEIFDYCGGISPTISLEIVSISVILKKKKKKIALFKFHIRLWYFFCSRFYFSVPTEHIHMTH